MPLAEELGVFFNAQEFATQALIRGHFIAGLEGHASIIVNEVETTQTAFTCASRAILEIVHGERILLNDDTYRVVGIRPDGTGLTRLILEFVCTSP